MAEREDLQGPANGIWQGPVITDLPQCDIVSYAFGRYGQYDLEEPILIDATNSDNYISVRKARTLVRQSIKGWKSFGLSIGDCVCLNSKNNIFWPVLFLGIVGSGGCAAGCNPAYTVPELIHHFKATKTRFIITQVDGLQNVVEAADQCGIPRSRILLLATEDEYVPVGYRLWSTLLDHGQCDWVRFDDEARARSTIAFLASTSGTTGLPKAAALSHRYFVAQDAIRHDATIGTSKIVQLLCLPIFHAFAGQLGLITPLRRGIPTLMLPRYNLETFIEAVSRYGVTDTAIVPPIVSSLLSLDRTKTHRLKSLRYIVCAGASLDQHVQSRLYDHLPEQAVISQVWGTTETAWITTFSRDEKDGSGSIGRLLPGTELKIIDDDGKCIAEEGARGEALIRSPSMFSGYLSNILANAEAFDAEGFYRTGDLAYYEDGKVYIEGRIKDVMKVRGWQVSPAEIEGILLAHPLVKDVAVVGRTIHDAHGLEETLPCAFIVPRTLSVETSILTTDLIHDFLNDKVVSYKKLSGGIRFVDSIPRNPTGKILRRILQDRLRNGR